MSEPKQATVKDLREWLKQYPDDTLVEIAVAASTGYAAFTRFVPFTVDDCATQSYYYTRGILELGEI